MVEQPESMISRDYTNYLYPSHPDVLRTSNLPATSCQPAARYSTVCRTSIVAPVPLSLAPAINPSDCTSRGIRPPPTSASRRPPSPSTAHQDAQRPPVRWPPVCNFARHPAHVIGSLRL
ncbi:hypothetical protein I7I51_05263, partial [Histoplasma capsulatum]